MKCPNCNGQRYKAPDVPCGRCGGKGVVEPLTNEEYIRSCSTEELVKMILDMCEDKPCFACGIGYCDDENWCHVYSDEAREFVLEWLKEKHHE